MYGDAISQDTFSYFATYAIKSGQIGSCETQNLFEIALEKLQRVRYMARVKIEHARDCCPQDTIAFGVDQGCRFGISREPAEKLRPDVRFRLAVIW